MSYMTEANDIAAKLRRQHPPIVRHGRKKAEAPSPRNLEVLDFCRKFFAENDQLPPAMRISEHFGWTSMNAAQLHLDALIHHGLLERNAVGKLRFARKEVAHG